MKRIIIALLLGGIGFSLQAQQTITRFAVVDMNRVVDVYHRQSAAGRAFTEKSAQVQAEINRLTAELQDLKTRLAEAQEQKKRSQIRTLESQVGDKTKALQEYIKKSFAELEQDRAKLTDDAFLTRLNTILRIVAESDGYNMVLNKEGAGILWYSPSVDITNKVLERLRTGNTRR
jgi:outer membrane protein